MSLKEDAARALEKIGLAVEAKRLRAFTADSDIFQRSFIAAELQAAAVERAGRTQSEGLATLAFEAWEAVAQWEAER